MCSGENYRSIHYSDSPWIVGWHTAVEGVQFGNPELCWLALNKGRTLSHQVEGALVGDL